MGTKTLTKADLIETVYNRLGFSKREAEVVVDIFFSSIKGALSSGQNVKLSGFGNFMVNEKKPRRGRNPQTGEQITIEARRVLSFKTSQVFKKELNED